MTTLYVRKVFKKQLSISNPEPKNEITKEDPPDVIKDGYYYFGKKDYMNALKSFQKPNVKSSAEAQFWLGSMYRNGKGVQLNHLMALECYLNSASLYPSYSYNQIGRSFERGLDVPVDIKRALEWYYKSNPSSYNTAKLQDKGYTLNQQEKEKHIDVLFQEAWEILNSEKLKRTNTKISTRR